LAGKAPLVILLGATGTGKTHLALELAQALDGEIIGADSRQVYRYMDIGTAKPSRAQQALVRHHLIDIVNPDKPLSLAQYLNAARTCIADVHARGKLPLLVGGSGQYITALEEGWTIPRAPPNPALRAELEAYTRRYSRAALHAWLRRVDAPAARKIHPNNSRRVIRALEVQAVTGQRISDLQARQAPPYRICRLGLYMARERLYPRVDARVDAMLAAGFLQEVARLLAMGYTRDLPAMSGLGYMQLTAHLLDGCPLDVAIERTKFATHEYIRQQDVWFRGHDNGILWHNGASLQPEQLIDWLREWLAEPYRE